jgi:predicted metalloprotease with PDZ domain
VKQSGFSQWVAAGALCALTSVSGAQAPAKPGTPDSPPSSAAPSVENADAQMEAARRKLEEAAREVAELSSREVGQHIEMLGEPRAIIGVQLDRDDGKAGARVRSVSPGGPAAQAGVRAGDIIVAVNGTDVQGEGASRKVVGILRDVKPDTKVSIKVLRDGKPLEIAVTARAAPGYGWFEGAFPIPPIPPMPPEAPLGPRDHVFVSGFLADLELATLTPQLGRYFGTDKGVLVVRAPEGGGLKLQDGDVILAIDGREPTSGSHATRILASYQPGEKVTLKIVRDRKTLNLETSLPERGAAPHIRGRVLIEPGDWRGGPGPGPGPREGGGGDTGRSL